MTNKLSKFFKNIFSKKKNDYDWLHYYNPKNNTIKFTNKTIYEYFISRSKNILDLYALNYFGTRITYKEFRRRIDIVARSLRFMDVKKGDVVTICMPNTPEAVTLFYACSKIGAIADMVHPLSAPNEVLHYLKESCSKLLFLYDANYSKYSYLLNGNPVLKTVLISVKESMPRATQIGYQLLKGRKIRKPAFSDKYIAWKDFLSFSKIIKNNITVKSSQNDVALILHSGGTTGNPKGIMITNYSFNAEAQSCSLNVRNVKPKDKIMTILPIFHGFGLGVTVHCPLCLGVEVILIPEFNAKDFAKIIKNYRPNVIAGVPTLWEAMMTSRQFKNIDLSSLKYVISGGDHLAIESEFKINKFLESKGAKIVITKGYGMTECTAAASYTFPEYNKPGSIGIPMVGNKIAICKPNTIEFLNSMEEGEICISGPTVMKGYLNNEEETRKMLKRHKDGKMWLHTGDIGFINEDGLIYFTQRLKRVIISSGFNVYPSAIEESIMKHPKVKNCCVIGIPHPYKIAVPKAFIVLEDGIEPNAKIKAEIRIQCKKDLALYSQVKEMEFRKTLPRTLYNKIDYKALEKEEIEKIKKQ